MRKIFTLFFLLFIGKLAMSQDVSVIAITSPVSGCSLSATSSVTINVRNIGLTDLSGAFFDLSYTINGGAAVTDVGVSFASFAPNTTVSHTFATTANLSVAGSYTFTAYSTLATDINTTNDATTGYVVTSTAASVGGTVSGGTNVCTGSNSGALTLVGHIGLVLNWESSVDNGTTWVPISNTLTTQNYNNLTVKTMYRAQVQNGICSSSTANPDTMTINPTTVGGTVSGTATKCKGINSGTLTSGGGRVGNILKWQYSINAGSTWIDIANTSTTQTYTNLDTTTRYRVQVQSGACLTAFSSVAIITINPTTVGGTITGGAAVCSGANTGNLTLTGSVGTITRWEYSTDAGANWLNISNTTTTNAYLNLITTTYYRALVKSGVCSQAYSSADSIVVGPASIGGTIDSAATVCSGVNTDTLTLSGYSGNINYWEYSTDSGSTWDTIANTTDTLSYLNLTTTTIYRANVQLGSCLAANSGTVTITVNPLSVGGTTAANATYCSGAGTGTINLSGHTGSIDHWLTSTDGIIWDTIANTTASQLYLNLDTTTYYQVRVTSGVCSSALSSIDTITIIPPAVGGIVSSSTNVCFGNNSGMLTLSGETGSVIRWETSSDGGNNWISINNTTTTYNYSNLTVTTLIRAVVQNGACPVTDNSSIATLTVDPMTVPGTISGTTTVCGGANSGSLQLFAYVGTPLFWESSIDGGATWDSIINTSATLNYLNDTITKVYRVIIASGVCSSDTSLTATVTVDSPPIAGHLTSNDTVCSGANSGTLTLTGYYGSIINWELSTDAVTWYALSNKDSVQSYLNLTKTSYYRAFINSGVCLGTISNIDTITVDPVSDAGSITGDLTVCAGDSIGILTDLNYKGVIQNWEGMTDVGISGGIWFPLSLTSDTISYNIPVVVFGNNYYRVITKSGVCPADTSVAAKVTVNSKPVISAGADVSISLGSSVALEGSGKNIISWTWNPGSTLSDSTIVNPLASPIITTIYSLMGTDANGCMSSDSVTVTVLVDYMLTATNLMTPNGDGFNDTWTIENIQSYPETKVVILDRNGQEVYTSDAYDNSWGGTVNGSKLADGTYYYFIQFKNDPKIYKGAITILNEKSSLKGNSN